ncbi:MAG TPA: hypothetical protein ENJ54_01185 [Chloroflexi bacterium]|nr:hypothetical protein [Chloroflexota bacterium]
MFAFRLALALGVPNPDDLLAQMDARLFDEWQAYFEAEPWGTQAQDVRLAMLLQTLIAVNAAKSSDMPRVEELLPTWSRQMLRAAQEAEREASEDTEQPAWKAWKESLSILAQLPKR